MRASRLVSLLLLLQTRGQMTAAALARELEVSVRSIHRDVEALSEASRGFYAENRRVANGKARRVLGWRPRYPDYRFGLRALIASTSPASASTAPAAASRDQR